uniref:cysteine dioxygenase n=1 Tax=Oryza sativa subsp. japonica TaxID=39947 RepID=Q2QQF6_ORYSJ|nr:hypothetical protein LOC_Os12g31210 [Oryza sativa Japonica Group]
MDQSEHHHRLAFAAADWCFRLHGWPIMPPLLGVYVFTDRLAFAAADWCFRLNGWPLCRRCWASTSLPTGLPSPPPTGVSACTAGLLCRRCWASTSSPTGLPSPPPTGVSACTAGLYAAVVGRLRLHRPAASTAADWCFRLHGWPIMPPLLGVYVFTDRLAFAAADWCFRLHGWPLCRRCWASTSSPTGCLVRRRLVLPPARLTYYAAVVGRLRLHRLACLRRRRLVFPPARLAFMPPLLGVYVFPDRLAFAAADWCFRLHSWPIMPPLLGAYVFTDRLAFVAADWCPRLHGWPIMPPLLGAYVFTDRLAFVAADWCPRLLGWPIMPPLLGAYVFTDRLAFVAADWCPRLHGWPIMPPLLGAYVFTDRLAFAAADWCPRLHGWPLCRRCWASTSSPTGLPSPSPTGVSACTAGLYAAVVGRLRLHRPACLRRRRLVSSPARLAFMPPLLGVYVFTDRLAFAAADWCFRLHGWPLCRRSWASTSSLTGLPSPPPTGVSACTAGLYAAVVGRLRLHRLACLRRRRLVFPPARLAFMPPLLGVYVFTDRPPHPPLTGVTACTAGLL